MSRLDDRKIAQRYAKALFEGALEQNQGDTVFQDLQLAGDVFHQVPDLLVFMTNPGIPQAEKQELLEKHFVGQVTLWVSNTLKLLLENDRIGVFPLVVEQFEILWNEYKQIATAEVITATEISASLQKKLQKALESSFQYNQVHLQHRVDPGILGGVIIKLQDRVIDASFVGKLESLRTYIAS